MHDRISARGSIHHSDCTDMGILPGVGVGGVLVSAILECLSYHVQAFYGLRKRDAIESV